MGMEKGLIIGPEIPTRGAPQVPIMGLRDLIMFSEALMGHTEVVTTGDY